MTKLYFAVKVNEGRWSVNGAKEETYEFNGIEENGEKK